MKSETLADLVGLYLDACMAVEAEAIRAEQPKARAWSSAPVVKMLYLRDDLSRALCRQPFQEWVLSLRDTVLKGKGE